MAVQTIYPLGTTAVTPNWWGNTQLNGTAPTQVNSGFGPKVATYTPAGSGGYWKMSLGATSSSGVSSINSFISTGPIKGTSSSPPSSGDSFIVGPFNGIFAAGSWTFNWNMRNTNAAQGTGNIRMRCWRSVNASGASATEIMTSGAVSGAVVTTTTADANSQIILSPAAFTLTNEYLFFQLEWLLVSAGNNINGTVVFRIGATTITTPDFQLNPIGTLSLSQAVQVLSANAVILAPPAAQIVMVV